MKKIKELLFAGAFFSCIACIIWLLSSANGRKIAVALLVAATAVFLLHLFVDMVIKGCGNRVKKTAKVLETIADIVIFLSASIIVVAGLMMFYPHFDEESYEKLQSKENAQEISIKTASGEIRGWRLGCGEENAPIVLYFGGNGENASTRIYQLCETPSWENPFSNCDFLFFDYPGYGKNDGSPSEASMKKSGVEEYDWVKENYPDSEIIVMGYSIGTGVANYVAMEREIDGLILMAPYADGYDLYNSNIDMFYGPMRLLVTFRMEAVEFASSIQIQPMILASDEDEMVPIESSIRLSEAYPKGCKFITIDEITHNQFWDSQEVREAIADYIKEMVHK